MDILDKLNEYCGADYVPMHMPGAKRNTELFHMGNPYGIDITEIEGFDNMHHPEDLIKDAFERSAKLFGADETLFLVNGSSAGLLSAICGATHKHDRVLVARNCHKAVYNALYLNELNPVYIYPQQYTEQLLDQEKRNSVQSEGDSIQIERDFAEKERHSIHEEYGIYGRIMPEDVKSAFIKDPDITAVILTSPTYEGVVSDISAIAAIVHEAGKVLIVDEAHGAHFNFHKVFPKSAVYCGADAVIQSIHKTLPAFTQTALLHMNGSRIDRERVRRYWDMFQTTSPSYILMGGIDRCMTFLENSSEYFEQYTDQLIKLRNELKKLKNIQLLETDDISKIVLLTQDGKWLQKELLQKYHIELEMASLKYVIAMTSVGDKPVYYSRFLAALQEIDEELERIKRADDGRQADTPCSRLCKAQVRMNLYEAANIEGKETDEQIRLEDALGRVAVETVCFYPPGIPIVNPGEVYTKEVISNIEAGVKAGLEVLGVFNQRVRCEKALDKVAGNGIIQEKNVKKEVYVKCMK